MATIFVFYALGFAGFLVVAYLCVQLGWLFLGEGKVHVIGMLGLSGLAAVIFMFVTFVGSVQLSGWVPETRKITVPKVEPGTDFATLSGQVKKKLGEKPEKNVTEQISNFWEDQTGFGVSLPKMQGVTGVQSMIHDISQAGFLNRFNPLSMTKPEGISSAGGPNTGALARDDRDREIFHARIKTIQDYFKRELRIPDIVLAEQLRRTEEIFLAVTQGKVDYPYVRYEFSLIRSQAVSLVEKYNKEQADGNKLLTVKIPVEIDLFGERFDLGVCALTFSHARLDPSLDKVKLAKEGQAIKMSVVPLKKPAIMQAVYEKFQPAGAPPVSAAPENPPSV